MTGDLKQKTNRSVHNALRYLYDIHRPMILSGIGSDMYAESRGNSEIALNAVTAAQEAALKEWERQNCTDEKAEDAARVAALAVFNRARSDKLIFLRDGTKSATIVKAYLISSGYV